MHQQPNQYSFRQLPLVLLCLVLCCASCGAAQPRLVLNDSASTLDSAQIERAAAPLLARGATVAVFTTREGDASGSDFTRRLEAAGLQRGGQIVPEALALYISYEPRYSELRAGTNWSDALPDTTLRDIRLNRLNPLLVGNVASQGVAATLAAFDQQLERAPLVILRANAALIIILLIVLFGFVWFKPVRRLRTAFASSRLGQVANRFWLQTPFGRHASGRQVAIVRQQLQRAAREAHSLYAQLPAPADDLAYRLTQADQQQAALAQQPPDDPALLAELRRLVTEFQAIAADARALNYNLNQRTSALHRQASEARSTLARVQGSFRSTRKPAKYSRKPPPEIALADLQQLQALETRLAEIDTQRATLAQPGQNINQRLSLLRELQAAYNELNRAGLDLWRTAYPAAFAAAMREQPQTSAGSTSDTGGATSSSDYSSTSSSSSDYSSASSSDSSSSSPSSDGGSW